MSRKLLDLWHCWISSREHRKPVWKTYFRLLSQMPHVRDDIEDLPYYRIYQERLNAGQYAPDPQPRGRWSKGQWLMRPST